MKSPEEALTGNGVSGSHKTGSDGVRILHRFLRFFLAIVVVQNVPLRMTESSMGTVCAVTESYMTPKGFPWKGVVRASATGCCTTFALLGPFHRK